MKVENMEIGPRTMMVADGKPMPVTLMMREAASAPGRVKAKFVLATQDPKGEVTVVPMPLAQATLGVGGKPRGYATEFRLEMN
jgi:hypothetical protein